MSDTPEMIRDVEAMLDYAAAPLISYEESGTEPSDTLTALVAIRLLYRSHAMLAAVVSLMDDKTLEAASDYLAELFDRLAVLLEGEMIRTGEPELSEAVDTMLEELPNYEFDDEDSITQSRTFVYSMVVAESRLAKMAA